MQKCITLLTKRKLQHFFFAGRLLYLYMYHHILLLRFSKSSNRVFQVVFRTGQNSDIRQLEVPKLRNSQKFTDKIILPKLQENRFRLHIVENFPIFTAEFSKFTDKITEFTDKFTVITDFIKITDESTRV